MDHLNATLPLIVPEMTLAIGTLGLLVLGAFRGEKGAGLISGLSVLLLVVAAACAAISPLGIGFKGAFVQDGVAVFAKVAMYLASALTIILGQGFFARKNAARFEFPLLVVLATLGISMMASAGDLIALYIGIELQSLALYVLTAFQRDDEKGAESGLKYFVLGALSSGLLLYGASLVYGFAGSMAFTDIAAVAAKGTHSGLIFGLVFLLCGLAFKVSAAPFHMWTPDVYEGAPTPVVAFAAAAPKFAALVLIARVVNTAFAGGQADWSQILIALSVLSFGVGAFGGLMQKNIKRLLAYSSIANMGYALMALAVGTASGLQGVLLFMVLYMIDTTGLFAAQMSLSREGKAVETIDQLSGLSKLNPKLALAITVFCLSVLGMPPFSGFWAKVFVFGPAIQEGYWLLAVGGFVASVVAAFYYLRIIKTMWFDPPLEALDASPLETKIVTYGAALFSAIGVWSALAALYPLAEGLAKGFGLK